MAAPRTAETRGTVNEDTSEAAIWPWLAGCGGRWRIGRRVVKAREEDAAQRKIRFTSTHPPKDLFDKIESVVMEMGFKVHRGAGKLKVLKNSKCSRNPSSLLVCTEVFELGPSLYVVELRKSHGDSTLYRQLCERLSDELGACKTDQIARTESSSDDLSSLDGEAFPLSGF